MSFVGVPSRASDATAGTKRINEKHLNFILSRLPNDWRDEKEIREEEGLSSFDLIYRYIAKIADWYRLQAGTNDGRLDENQFLYALRKLTTFKDHEILDLFDLFAWRDGSRMAFDEFFMLLALLAARECGRCTQFLHLHARPLFTLLARTEDPNATISFERFSALAPILGISEQAILLRLREFGIGPLDPLSFEDFTLYYFATMDDLDKGNFEARSTVLTTIDTDQGDGRDKCILS